MRLATYNGWFAVPQGDGQAQEKGYPKGMPNYIKHTGGIPFAQVKQLMYPKWCTSFAGGNWEMVEA